MQTSPLDTIIIALIENYVSNSILQNAKYMLYHIFSQQPYEHGCSYYPYLQLRKLRQEKYVVSLKVQNL